MRPDGISNLILMDSLISISLELDKEFITSLQRLHKILEKKLNIKHYSKNHSAPHINILSGKCTKIKNINKIKIKKNYKKNINFIGIGIFPTMKSNIVYLRFEYNLFLKNLRKQIFKRFKSKFKKIDKTCTDLLWLPKCTIASGDVSNKKLGKLIHILNKYKFRKFTKPIKISILDYSKKEIKLSELKL